MELDIEKLSLLKAMGGSGGGGGGSSVTVEPLTVTTNGTTTAPAGKAYSPITVNVPNPSSGALNISANGTYDVTEKASAVVDVPGANLVALTATDNNTTYDPADYNADGFSSVSVEIAVPQVYVAQKQVSGNTVIYDFGVSVENCAVAPLQDEAARMGVGMDLNFREPRAVIDDSGTVFDDGNFKEHGYEFHAHNAPADRYPSALFAVAPN